MVLKNNIMERSCQIIMNSSVQYYSISVHEFIFILIQEGKNQVIEYALNNEALCFFDYLLPLFVLILLLITLVNINMNVGENSQHFVGLVKSE